MIDPIDGTLRFYLEGRGPYAVMIGLARERAYEAALVALPREELYLDAVRGRGARIAQRGSPPRAARAEATGKRDLRLARRCRKPRTRACCGAASRS